MDKITVGWMYPNLLNLHGERGSVQALVAVGKQLGIDVQIKRIEDFDDPIPFEELDMLMFLPGEIVIFNHLIPALENSGLKEYMEKFLAIDADTGYCAGRYPRLFYLWGHSHEFHGHDNWDVLEDIGKTLGGKDDIWYATNIEIYEYVSAYHALVRSADGKRVYNPTLIPVWFSDDTTTYCVRSGEILILD